MRARRRRLRLAASLLAVAAAGLASKLYAGPGAGWLNDSLAGLFYVVFWCLAAALLWPDAAPGRIALAVLAVTCALEAAQLWRPPWLQAVRSTFPGAALLGTTFVGSDFLYYLLGAAIGGVWIRVAGRLKRVNRGGSRDAEAGSCRHQR